MSGALHLRICFNQIKLNNLGLGWDETIFETSFVHLKYDDLGGALHTGKQHINDNIIAQMLANQEPCFQRCSIVKMYELCEKSEILNLSYEDIFIMFY